MNRVVARSLFVFLAAGSAASVASAAIHSYPSFNPAPAGVTTTWRNQDLNALGAAPNGTYVGYRVDVDWVGGNTGTSGSWSNEARVYFGSAGGSGTGTNPTGAGTAHTTAARQAYNGAGNNFNTTPLRFRGTFNTNYAQAGATPLFLNYRQTFGNTNVSWSNVRVTIYDTVDDALGVTDLGTITGPTSHTTAYTRTDSLRWYKFAIAQPISLTDYLSIDTTGNTLSGGDFGAGDTHIALFSSAGAVLATNDDFNNPGTLRESLILAGSQAASGFPTATGHGNAGATLPVGSYYLAVAPYQLISGAGFNVSGSVNQLVEGTDLTGNFKININTSIPSPGGVALVAIGGLIVFRRRR